MVGLNSKVSMNLANIIFNNTFWLIIASFLAYIHSKLSPYVLGNLSPDLVMFTFVFFLGHFATFANEVVYSFVNFTAHSKFTVLCFTDLGSKEVYPNGLVLSCWDEIFCLALDTTFFFLFHFYLSFAAISSVIE